MSWQKKGCQRIYGNRSAAPPGPTQPCQPFRRSPCRTRGRQTTVSRASYLPRAANIDMRFNSVTTASLIALLASAVQAQDAAMKSFNTSRGSNATAPVPYIAVAVRAAKAPVIDGRADDVIWASAQVIEGFRVYDP